jgi:bleomycin hydrolase
MRALFFGTLIVCNTLLFAGNDETNKITGENSASESIHIIKSIPTTPVKDQYKSGTCWSFSGISLLETELIRTGKGEYDLSEMFVVHYNYERKAERYVRMHGKSYFTAGGETNDVTDVIREFGIVPDSVYSGLKTNSDKHNHSEMDRVLEKYISSTVSASGKELNSVWEEGYDKVLDSYLGEVPKNFTYTGKEYTSVSFAKSLDLDLNNYVMITSFTQYPYYKPVILEIPDNWSWAESYNVPLDAFESIVDTAIMKGYSIAWAADISEEGFSFEKGFALAPYILYAPDSMREANKWRKKTDSEKKEYIFNLEEPVEELKITPELRENAFENYSTTDDHGMQILGLASDKNGRQFYFVKNSWGSDNPYNGYLFVSMPYFQYKSISIMLNKEALTAELRAKLNL